MKITKRHIPLIISATSFLISFIYDIYFTWKIDIGIESALSNSGTRISLISFVIIGLSFYMNQKVWVYLYLAFLVASFIPYLGITGLLNSTRYFGGIPINIIALILLFAHARLNGDLMQSEKSTNE